MEKITDKKKSSKIILLFVFVYMISYMTRIDFEGLISEIVSTEGIAKSLASISVTCLFICYGIGQLISGYLGERVQPKNLIAIGFATTATMNILIPFCSSAYLMAVVWSINGFAQAFMWPPIVKMLSEFFDDDTYKKGTMRVSWGSSFGTILIYLLGPVCISLFGDKFIGGKSIGWRAMFFFCAILAVVMMIIVLKICPKVEKTVKVIEEDTTKSKKFQFPFFIILIMIAIILQGMLRDGVTTWTPSLISEIFHLPAGKSILTGVFLPVFSIISFYIVSLINRKKIKNEVLFAGIIFAVGVVSALLLAVFKEKSSILTVLLCALLTGCMHGVNLMLVCIIPVHFKKYGNVSFMSGLLNFCTYVGSAIAIYGFAKVSEGFGWNTTLIVWSIIALAGSLVCFTISKKWNRFCD